MKIDSLFCTTCPATGSFNSLLYVKSKSLTMFKTLAFVSLVAANVVGSAQAVVLAQYTFGTVGSTTFAATTADPALTASDLTGNKPTGLNEFQIQGSLSTYPSPVLLIRPINGSTTAATTVSQNSYFSFTVGPASVGTTYSLTNLTFDAAKGGSSTRGWVVRSSDDGFASNLGTSGIGTVRPTLTNYQVSLGGSSFQDRTDPITFRIYTYTPGSTSSVEYDNITLNGSTVPIPEPSAALLAGLGLLALLHRRRRNAGC